MAVIVPLVPPNVTTLPVWKPVPMSVTAVPPGGQVVIGRETGNRRVVRDKLECADVAGIASRTQYAALVGCGATIRASATGVNRGLFDWRANVSVDAPLDCQRIESGIATVDVVGLTDAATCSAIKVVVAGGNRGRTAIGDERTVEVAVLPAPERLMPIPFCARVTLVRVNVAAEMPRTPAPGLLGAAVLPAMVELVTVAPTPCA